MRIINLHCHVLFIDDPVFMHNTSSTKNTKAQKKDYDENCNRSNFSTEHEIVKDGMTEIISIPN